MKSIRYWEENVFEQNVDDCIIIDFVTSYFELDSLDMMLSSLVEVLEKKGILTEDEWEKQIKANIEKNVGKTKFRDI